jgi:hypothetical protein
LAPAGTVFTTILLFSLQVNEDTRYLISTTPMIAVLLEWGASIWLSVFAAVCLSFCAAVIHARSFSYDNLGGTFFNYLGGVSHDRSRREFLTRIVGLTCDGRGWIALGVNYSFVNQNSADFYAGQRGQRPCSYANLSETDVDQAINRIFSYLARYIVTIPVDRQITGDQGHAPDFVNKISKALAEQLARDQRFVGDRRSDESLVARNHAA